MSSWGSSSSSLGADVFNSWGQDGGANPDAVKEARARRSDWRTSGAGEPPSRVEAGSGSRCEAATSCSREAAARSPMYMCKSASWAEAGAKPTPNAPGCCLAGGGTQQQARAGAVPPARAMLVPLRRQAAARCAMRAPVPVVRLAALGVRVRGCAATSGHTTDELPTWPVRWGRDGRRLRVARGRRANCVCVEGPAGQGGLDKTMQSRQAGLRQ